ncbi:hypothetical protein [Bradyrhizobium sp. 170]|uniref:hypothetical protein n=1 Tax=Bradyrhizobium sp. 170 TaxID=2782641 RepID=UPI001FFFB925|nr:hypothetical protein [Bradyrhizobium sp. 170]UPK07624.1 hypothetical protein IVB05_20200 [Bradyrhizobium sp. 170]
MRIRMVYMLVAGCLALLLPGYAAAQDDTKTAAATCGVDIDGEKANALEAACLREFGRLASRKGDLLTLRLESGASKVYRDDPKACETDDAKNCISHRLAAYHAEARVYSIVIQYYEGSSVELLSARTGKVLLVSGTPYFSPDGSRFVVIDNDYGHGGPHDLSVGSTANSSLSLEWEHLSEAGELREWRLERWIDNDHIALRVYPADADRRCPDNNCDAMLARFGNSWVIRRLSAPQQ